MLAREGRNKRREERLTKISWLVHVVNLNMNVSRDNIRDIDDGCRSRARG